MGRKTVSNMVKALKIASKSAAVTAAVTKLSNSLHDEIFNIGKSDGRGKLNALEWFQDRVAEGKLTKADARSTADAYCDGKEAGRGSTLSEATRKNMAAQFSISVTAAVMAKRDEISKLVTANMVKGGKEAYESILAVNRAVEKDSAAKVDATFVKAALKPKGPRNGTGKVKAPAAPALEGRALAVHNIVEALPLLGKMTDKREAALAAFAKAFGLKVADIVPAA